MHAGAQERNEFFKDTHTLATRWELVDSVRNGTFVLTSYKPMYVAL